MKAAALTFSILLLSLFVQSQSYRDAISVSTGLITVPDIIVVHEGMAGTLSPGSGMAPVVAGSGGGDILARNVARGWPWMLSYHANFDKRVSFSGTLAFQQFETLYTFENTTPGTDLDRFVTIIANMHLRWVNDGFLKVYSTLGGGASFFGSRGESPLDGTIFRESKALLAYQFVPLGARIGDKFGVFAELGFGYRGIITAGVHYAWGRADD